MTRAADALRATWVDSGALALTGWPGAPPLLAPPDIIERVVALGRPLQVDAAAVLTERAAVRGLRRGGRVSCGGATRLIAAADGLLAVSLARPDDIDAVPAWLAPDEPQDLGSEKADIPPSRSPDPAASVWEAVERQAAGRAAGELEDRAALLGLPVARRGIAAARPPVVATGLGEAPPVTDPLVVDLSALWAGPLCARLLRRRGARTVKVEAVARPDGARRGSAAFFDLLNTGTEAVALDLRGPDGIGRLRRLLARADVVIEASRPRALAQFGIDAAATVAEGPSVWVSITGHGRTGAAGERVAFGDDAAVAGGLVADDPRLGPCFVADAVADPLTGLYAAAAVEERLRTGGRWLLDVSMAAVAAAVAGAGGTWVPWEGREPPAPRVAPAAGPAPLLGAHTAAVFDRIAGP